MRRARLYIAVALVGACCVAVALTRGWDRSRQHDANEPGPPPFLPAEIDLPEVPFAQPLDAADRYAVVVAITADGRVLLPPDQSGGVAVPLDASHKVYEYARGKAAAQREQTPGEIPLGPVIVGVDRRTPFGVAYPRVKGCRAAGYERFHLRVVSRAGEGQLPIVWPSECGNFSRYEATTFLVVRAVATAGDEVAEITFRHHVGAEEYLEGDEAHDPPAERLGSDVAAAFEKIGRFADAVRQRVGEPDARGRPAAPPELILEIDERTPWATATELIGAGLRVGFREVSPMPIDVKKR